MKIVKFPIKYKYGFRLTSGPSRRRLIFWDRVWISKWVWRPICWIKGHDYHIYWPFGVKIKQCDRCAHIKYKKKTTERVPSESIYKGEIGELFKVRFIRTTYKQ